MAKKPKLYACPKCFSTGKNVLTVEAIIKMSMDTNGNLSDKVKSKAKIDRFNSTVKCSKCKFEDHISRFEFYGQLPKDGDKCSSCFGQKFIVREGYNGREHFYDCEVCNGIGILTISDTKKKSQ